MLGEIFLVTMPPCTSTSFHTTSTHQTHIIAATTPNFSFVASLNLPYLMKLTNDPIYQHPKWSLMPIKLPSYIPKFEGKSGEDMTNHIMTLHLWCSSSNINENLVHLRLF